MEVFSLICLAFLCIASVLLLGFSCYEADFLLILLSVLFIVLLFVTFSLTSVALLKNGSPITKIDVGDYKVAFIYQAGDNVSIGIEKPDSEAKDMEHIFLYQFPIRAFDNMEVFRTDQEGFPIKAKILSVTQSGDFKKLHLILK